MIRIVIFISIFVTTISSAVTEINGVTYTIGPNQTYLNADFSYADFSGVDFSGSTFTNCNLNHVSFNGASLIGTVFSYDRSLGRHDLSINLDFDNANLSGATFINADLHNQTVHQGPASFVNSTLLGITLYNYHMDTDPLDFRLPNYYTFIPADGSVGIILGPYVNLSGQDLTSLSNTVNNADLRGFPAWGVNLSNANLSDLHIPGINFTSANFQNSILNNTIMSNSTLQFCDFTGAVLNNANISHSDQGFAKYNNASMSNVYIWSCYLGGTDFTGADINGIQSGSCGYTNNTPPILPSGYILRNGHIVGPNANLTDATFNNFSFVGQDFSGANLNGVNFKHAVLSNANFSGSSLLGANLRGANLSNANIVGANLRGVNLDAANVSGLDLSGFDLSGANITGTTLVHVSPDLNNSTQIGVFSKDLMLSKIGNELQIYWDAADGETYQLSFSTNGIDWHSYDPMACERTTYAQIGYDIATEDEIEYRNTHWADTNKYAVMRMTAVHSMESMTNAPMIMFKVESTLSSEFN